MQQATTVYLSLGSNLEDRFEYLQLAITKINQSAGKIKNISSIYENPAWGFKGLDFYNICLALKTKFPPVELLKTLKEIEKNIGRKEKTTTTYKNRCIDIDIISFGNQTINSEELTIPHPRAIDRKFVLIPLAEICDGNEKIFNNHTLKKNIEDCPDTSSLTPIPQLKLKL